MYSISQNSKAGSIPRELRLGNACIIFFTTRSIEGCQTLEAVLRKFLAAGGLDPPSTHKNGVLPMIYLVIEVRFTFVYCLSSFFWGIWRVEVLSRWVCLKMEYTPNYSHLVGIMIINHWV